MVRRVPREPGDDDYESKIAAEVQKRLLALARREAGPSLFAPKQAQSEFFNSVAQYLLKNPTKALPLGEALTLFTLWDEHIRKAQTDIAEAERVMRQNGDFDNANMLVGLHERLDRLAEEFRVIHTDLIRLKDHRQRESATHITGNKNRPSSLKSERSDTMAKWNIKTGLQELISVLDKAHRDMGSDITETAWQVYQSQVQKHGFTFEQFTKDPEHKSYQELGLTQLHRMAAGLQTGLMESLNGHIAGLYMLALEEQARIKIRSTHLE